MTGNGPSSVVLPWVFPVPWFCVGGGVGCGDGVGVRLVVVVDTLLGPEKTVMLSRVVCSRGCVGCFFGRGPGTT